MSNNRMVKFVSCLVVLCASLNAMSQTELKETPDTLINISLPSRLVITESENGMKVAVNGKEDNEDFSVSAFTEYTPNSSVKSTKVSGKNEKDWMDYTTLGMPMWYAGKESKFSLIATGVAVGLINPVSQYPEGGLQWSKSFEICWMMCCGIQYSLSHVSTLSFGLGFDWRNYKITTSDKCLVTNQHKGLEWGNYPDATRGRYSRLKVFSLQLPLLFSWKLPKSSLRFKCGPIFNFNTYASVLSVYDNVSGNETESFTKLVSPRRFTLDFFGSLSYRCGIGIYVRYSPIKVIDSPATLNFYPLSMGVTFAM